MNGTDRILLDSVQLRGFILTPQEFAATLNWEVQQIYWGVNPPTPAPSIPTLSALIDLSLTFPWVNTVNKCYLIFLVFRFPTGRRSLPLQSVPPGPQTNVASRPLSDGAASNSTGSPSAKLRKPSICMTVCASTQQNRRVTRLLSATVNRSTVHVLRIRKCMTV